MKRGNLTRFTQNNDNSYMCLPCKNCKGLHDCIQTAAIYMSNNIYIYIYIYFKIRSSTKRLVFS